MRQRLRSVVIGSVVILGHLYGEQLTSAGQVPDAPTIGKEAVMADAVEARGQDVEEKAAHELGVSRVMVLYRSRPFER